MSLYGALFSGVSGLAAQSSAMGAISDNITNVNTIGYKGSKVNFQTLVTKQTSTTQYSPGGVQSKPRHGIDVQGLLQASSSSTDVALSGQGFFVVNQTADPYTSGNSMFAYTRAGSFKVDREGYMQNVSGWYMQGWPLMPTDNTPQAVEVTGSDGRSYMKSYKHPVSGQLTYINDNIINPEHLKPLNLNEISGTASKTRNIRLGANLPADDEVNANHKTNVLIYDTLGGTHNTEYVWTKTSSNVWDLSERSDAYGITNMAVTTNAADTTADFTVEGEAGGGTYTLNNPNVAFSAAAGTITFSTATDGDRFPVGTTFTVASAEDTANNGTYYVTANNSAGMITVSNTKYFAERGIPAPSGSAVAVVYDADDAVYAAQGRLDFTAANSTEVAAMDAKTFSVTVNGVAVVFEFSTDGAIAGTSDVEIDISTATEAGDVATAVANAMRNPRNYINAINGNVAAAAFATSDLLPIIKGNGSTVEIIQRAGGEALSLDVSTLSTYCTQSQARSLSASGTTLTDVVSGTFDIPAISQVGSAVTFNGDGTPQDFNVAKVGVTWANGSRNMTSVNSDIDERMDLFLGNTEISDGLTQLAGSYQLAYISQDGAQFGNFAGVSIGDDGIVTALFDNGVTRPVFQIPIATFVNPNGMDSLTGNVFIATDYSGEGTLREAGEAGAGSVAAASLEASTVDIGEEFTTMIVTQRAYSAAAKIITTADEMLDELVRIKR
jgi:flagellar hook protein FlgE